MPTRPVGVTDQGNAAGVMEADVLERASPDLFTTTTADPGAAGTALAITSAARFPASGQYKIRVEQEVMYVTAGQGTTGWTVLRGQDYTNAVAHPVGSVVSYVVGVQRVSPVDERQITYKGRTGSLRVPGRAGTTGQKIFAIHNATGSAVIVDIEKIAVDITATVVKAVTVLPPIVRLVRFTAVPTGGNTGTKAPEDTSLVSNSSVTLWQDASVDGTLSGTALTLTAGAVITEEFAPRLITAAGYEMSDRMVFSMMQQK
jgi:hypothetical protein